MRAIIIDDKDARALLDKLKLESKQFTPGAQAVGIGERCNMTRQDLEFIVAEIHKKFHYEVCSWLQDQGATVTRY